MASSKHGPVKDKIRLRIERELYRLEGKNPCLGSGVRFDLAVGEGGTKRSVSPRLNELCWDLGLFDVIFRRIQESVALELRREPWEYAALRAYQRAKLENKWLSPIRGYWKERYYFYCIPPPMLLEKDMETGQLLEVREVDDTEDDEGNEMKLKPSRVMVLSALPVDPKDAVDNLGVRKQQLEELAPQVGWIVLRLIGIHVIRSRQDAEQRLTCWLPYLTKHTHQLINERVRGYLT